VIYVPCPNLSRSSEVIHKTNQKIDGTSFSGPIPSVNLTMIAYPGTLHFRAGKRTAQRYTYSPRFPVLEYNTAQGAFFGGNFWDARSTGYKLQSADAGQAQHSPVDTQEMGFPDTACIAFRLSTAVYRPLFETVWGDDLDIAWPSDTAAICATPTGSRTALIVVGCCSDGHLTLPKPLHYHLQKIKQRECRLLKEQDSIVPER
jgi:cytochrome c peroxidase